MKLTKGLLLRYGFTKNKGAFDKGYLSINFNDNVAEGIWIKGQWMPSIKFTEFKRLQSLWFGITGEELKPIFECCLSQKMGEYESKFSDFDGDYYTIKMNYCKNCRTMLSKEFL